MLLLFLSGCSKFTSVAARASRQRKSHRPPRLVSVVATFGNRNGRPTISLTLFGPEFATNGGQAVSPWRLKV